MFPDQLQLPALTHLHTPYFMPWEAADLDRLISSCSHLQILSLCCSPGLQLTALLRLTALTRLWLTGVTEDSTTASLVQLSALQGLQDLSVLNPCSFTDDAVRSLTALTQLTRLGLSDHGVFSTTMQQQLLQHFGRERIAGGFACHPIKNTVSTVQFECAVQQSSNSQCFHILLVCNACACSATRALHEP